jgi:hypothetical protein
MRHDLVENVSLSGQFNYYVITKQIVTTDTLLKVLYHHKELNKTEVSEPELGIER